MRRGTAWAVLAVVVAATAGCAGGSGDNRAASGTAPPVTGDAGSGAPAGASAPDGREPSGDVSAPGAAPASDGGPAAGGPAAFAEDPAFFVDLADPQARWGAASAGPGATGRGPEGLTIRAPDGQAYVTASPWEVRPGHREVLVETEVAPPASGEIGAACRLTPDAASGYAVALRADGERYRFLRLDGGAVTTIDEGEVGQPPVPSARGTFRLRLMCGRGLDEEPVALTAQFNESPLITARDPDALPTPETTGAGVLVVGGADTAVTVRTFAVRYPG